MSDSNTSRIRPGGRFFLVAGWVIFAVLLSAFIWQKSVEASKTDEAGDYLAVATLIESAEADAVEAGALLQQYVATGDESLLPQMQVKSDSGVRSLTSAINRAGGDPGGFVSQGSLLVQVTGQVVAMRQAGDIEAASEALIGLGERFSLLVEAQTEFVADQRASASTATDAGNTAQSTALALLIAAAIVGVTMVVGTTLIVGRRIANRRTMGPLSGEPA